MTSAFDLKAGVGNKIWAAPIALRSALGERGGHIHTRQSIGACGNGIAAGQYQRHQLFQMRRFGGQRMAAGLRDADRFFMQFWRIEPHSARHRLPMGKACAGGHQCIAMLGRHLDKITQNGIVPDFERGYARRIAITRFQLRDRLSSIAPRNPQGVQSGIIAFGDIAALRGVGGR